MKSSIASMGNAQGGPSPCCAPRSAKDEFHHQLSAPPPEESPPLAPPPPIALEEELDVMSQPLAAPPPLAPPSVGGEGAGNEPEDLPKSAREEVDESAKERAKEQEAAKKAEEAAAAAKEAEFRAEQERLFKEQEDAEKRRERAKQNADPEHVERMSKQVRDNLKRARADKPTAGANCPKWCALTKVSYRVVGSDMQDLTRVNYAVDKHEFVEADYLLERTDNSEWLKEPYCGYLLPLRHPTNDESLWVLMESKDGRPAVQAPRQVAMGFYPPKDDSILELPMIPENAPPGGKWEEAKFCGPVSLGLLCCPCCWICLMALGKCGPIDTTYYYKDLDGLMYDRAGKVVKPVKGD